MFCAVAWRFGRPDEIFDYVVHIRILPDTIGDFELCTIIQDEEQRFGCACIPLPKRTVMIPATFSCVVWIGFICFIYRDLKTSKSKEHKGEEENCFDLRGEVSLLDACDDVLLVG
jgi:hypothetical protein